MNDNNNNSSTTQGSENSSNFDDSLNIAIDQESEDNGLHWGWDLLIDAVVVVGLCVAAVVAAPVSIVAAIGFGLAAVYVAWTSEPDSNVLTDTKRLITTASIATLGATRWLGMTGVLAGTGGLMLSGLLDWLNADITGIIILGVIALILWSELRSEDSVIITDEDEKDVNSELQS